MTQRMLFVVAALVLSPLSARADDRCQDLLERLGDRVADATCFVSTDLTTRNPLTTPADNSLVGQPAGAFTPTTDRGVIAPSAAKRTPIHKVVPGLQVAGRFADDKTGQGRFLIRLPDDWNGRLVVAGASGTRSEHNGDFAWSDYVVQKGYAYVSQNKGVFNLKVVNAQDPLGCRLNPSLAIYVHFFDNDPGQEFTRWRDFIVAAARLGKDAVKGHYGRHARFTYAVGTSNGGYQVRRAIESAPELFDGGVDWEGTFVDEHAPNLLTDLPAAVLNWPDYVASGFNAASTAARNILAAGYPPDILANGKSLWGNYWGSFWEVTLCQWQKRLDPSYDTYGSGTGNYNYVARLSAGPVGQNVAAFATTGRISRPLITVAGTLDGLLPIDHHARAYARKVAAHHGEDDDDDRHAAYRLYEIQNGNHIETYQDTFAKLELIEPHAQASFDLLVDHVEQHRRLPPSQCVPHGGAIAAKPGQPGHCVNLYEP